MKLYKQRNDKSKAIATPGNFVSNYEGNTSNFEGKNQGVTNNSF